MGYKHIWQTILKVILCISICILVIFLFSWSKKYFAEGFQSAATTTVDLGTGRYGGTSTPAYNFGDPKPDISATVQTNVVLLNLSGSGLKNYTFQLPVKILLTDNTIVATGKLFAYNAPTNVTIIAESGTPWTVGTGIIWASGTPERNADTVYKIQANFCDIEENKPNASCARPNIGDPLPPETPTEQNIYDTYEMYNIDNPPTPSYTQVQQYDMASELSNFDTGAPIPWDYDNRMFNPNDILWGNVHPNVSQEIFQTAYTRELLKSINNLEYDESSSQWKYKSLIFERTWTGDDKRFLPNIQFAEFLVETGIGMVIGAAYSKGQDAIMTKTTWGKQQSGIISAINESEARRSQVYFAALNSQMSQTEAKAFSDRYATQHFNDRIAMNILTDDEKVRCINASESVMNNGNRAANDRDLAKIMEADDAMRREAVQIENSRKAPNVDPVNRASLVQNAGNAVPSTPAARLARPPQIDPNMKVSGNKYSGVTAAVLRMIGFKGATKLAQVSSGKIAVKLARAIGITVAGEGLLWGVATTICSATGGTSCPVLYGIVTAINAALDAFVIACCSFVPAILAAYIPEDALCPPGYFNIRDAMIKLPGGEAGWQIIGAIPGFGDGLATFGPYLCSKVENGLLTETVLKKEPLTPGYYYDSTLSIFCDTTKKVIREDNDQFKDSRRYTQNNSDIPPIWVDFSDTAMLDKMAQFYYTYSRKLATNNYDGTYTFDYISKLYGVITSSLYSCDVQCEITRLTYYESTGVEQSKYIIPVDPTNGTTYHDRRFYFYPIQVENTTSSEDNPARISAKNIETMYARKLGYTFLTWDQRKNYLKGDDSKLNDLMKDNQMRYIVTACTNADGTAPNATEVNSEGDYVGDALISLGNDASDPRNPSIYYPPAVSINRDMLIALTSAYTIVSINLEARTNNTVRFTYDNPLVTFIVANTDGSGRSNSADTVKGVVVNSSNVPQNADTQYFIGTVKEYKNGTPQILIIEITQNTIPAGSQKYLINVSARSSGVTPPMNDNGCSAIRNKAYKYGQRVSIPDDNNADSNGNSFTITTPSPNSVAWNTYKSSANSRQSTYLTGFNTAKIWRETYEGQIQSDDARNNAILQGTAMGYIGFRVNYGMIPVGAILTQGVMNTNFEPDWSIASLISCSYQDALKSFGTYVSNGEMITIQTGTTNRYLFINRGPIIKFAPGYIPVINQNIIHLAQSDCISRYAIRRIVKSYNDQNRLEQVSKILRIETDNTNKKCLYMMEVVPYNSTTNTRALEPRINKIVTVPYTQSSSKYALIQGTTLTTAVLRPNGTYDPVRPNFTVSIAPIDFPTSGTMWGAAIIPSRSIHVTATPGNPSTIFIPTTNLTRQGSSDQQVYNCASPNIQNRLIAQFNAKNRLNPAIISINKSYAPFNGVNNNDGTFTCIYDANVNTIDDNNGMPRTDITNITMTLIPANDPKNALYDLLKDNYPSAYVYSQVPKPNQWIDIPMPILPESTITRTNGSVNCAISTCENLDLISNLVNQFNKQMVDGKIMKVRKAYTPSITGSNICDFEVEMLRVINETSSIMQKESIRFPLVASATDPCMWNLNLIGSNVPDADTGHSLTNSASVAPLENPYVWAPSYITSITTSINNSLKDYIGLGINDTLSNAIKVVNRQIVNVYNTVMTSQYLTHPNPTCKNKCGDIKVLQAIIDRYYADNYPASQYGVQRAKMIEIRRAGTYTGNQCQIEFIERVDSYKNFISSVIFSSDAYDPDALFNTKYYLRQYQFDMLPDENECAHNMVPIANLVANNQINTLDISGNALAIMSDSSIVPKATSDNLLSYKGKDIECTNVNVLNAVVNIYNTTARFKATNNFNTITNISTVFNQRANVCEYNAVATKWFQSRINNSYYTLPGQKVTLQAQWGSYNPRKGLTSVAPDSVLEYDPALITMKIDSNGNYQSYNSIGNIVILPYTYQLPSAYDTTRVSTIRFNCTNGTCSFS